ncbi:MAG: hypothetical protein K9G67_01350 [Bacteroidales bacterium]|nr:hypothetical protein [Bacteroidales bacterium]MCF8350077.1 hypothetical protein [Bacteroidales bacterium]MCF8374979.1 hypothetical protein [Bacteroidales bacterium]
MDFKLIAGKFHPSGRTYGFVIAAGFPDIAALIGINFSSCLKKIKHVPMKKSNQEG